MTCAWAGEEGATSTWVFELGYTRILINSKNSLLGLASRFVPDVPSRSVPGVSRNAPGVHSRFARGAWRFVNRTWCTAQIHEDATTNCCSWLSLRQLAKIIIDLQPWQWYPLNHRRQLLGGTVDGINKNPDGCIACKSLAVLESV